MLPLETPEAYRDHAEPHSRIEQVFNEASSAMAHLPDLGINIDTITQQLKDEGVQKFVKAFDGLMNGLK
jgi:transaldolase